MSDRIFGGIGLLLAAFYIWQATLIQDSFISDPLGPKAFPIIIGVVLGARQPGDRSCARHRAGMAARPAGCSRSASPSP